MSAFKRNTWYKVAAVNLLSGYGIGSGSTGNADVTGEVKDKMPTRRPGHSRT